MIDPENITRYNLTKHGLEENLFFWVMVSGKTADVVAPQCNRLLKRAREKTGLKRAGTFDVMRAYREKSAVFVKTLLDIDVEPHEMIHTPNPVGIRHLLRVHGIGCHGMKSQAVEELIDSNLNLATCSLSDLTNIYGIALKTASCFILHTRADSDVSGLDTHMLAEIRSRGYRGVPKSTPANVKTYEKWSLVVKKMAAEAGMTMPQFDLAIFTKRHRKVGRDKNGKLAKVK